MNIAQQALLKKFHSVVQEVSYPLSSEEFDQLIENMKKVNHESIWGMAITAHFNKKHQGPIGSKYHHAEFLKGLASQCLDDFFTMAAIVGTNNAILLLRYSLN